MQEETDLEDYKVIEYEMLETQKNSKTFIYEIRLLQHEYTNEFRVQRRWGYLTKNRVWKDNDGIRRAKQGVHSKLNQELYTEKIKDKLRHGYKKATNETKEFLLKLKKES